MASSSFNHVGCAQQYICVFMDGSNITIPDYLNFAQCLHSFLSAKMTQLSSHVLLGTLLDELYVTFISLFTVFPDERAFGPYV